MENFKYAIKFFLFFLISCFISACSDRVGVETSMQTDGMSFLDGASPLKSEENWEEPEKTDPRKYVDCSDRVEVEIPTQKDSMSFLDEASSLKSEESREEPEKTDPRKYVGSIENAYAYLLPFSSDDPEIGRIMTEEEILASFNDYKSQFQNKKCNLETITWLMNMNAFLTDTYIFQHTLSFDFSDLNATEWSVLSCDYFQSLSELEEMLYMVYEKPFADYIISLNIFSEKEGEMILHYPGNWTYDVFKNRTYIRIDWIDDNECEFTWFYPDSYPEEGKWFIKEKKGLAVCCEGKWKLAYMLYANPEISIENYRMGLYRQ